MRPARRGGPDFGSAFTFGGRIPSGLGLLIALILVATVGSWLTGNRGWAALVPGLLVRGEIWRFVSWAFVQSDPLTLLFGGFMLFSIGGQLSFVWGEKRLLATFAGLTLGASFVTVVLALFWAPANSPHLGMWPVVNGLIFMWAMLFPDRQVNIWGILPVTGKTIALLLVFGTLLYGLAAGGIAGLGAFTPHFAALGIGYALSRGNLPTRRWKLQAREWLAEREFKRRSKHLKVIKKNGSKDEPPRWMN